jgi:hypothetical protein
VVDFSADGVDAKQDRAEADLTPAQLHHLILDVIRSRSGKS